MLLVVRPRPTDFIRFTLFLLIQQFFLRLTSPPYISPIRLYASLYRTTGNDMVANCSLE